MSLRRAGLATAVILGMTACGVGDPADGAPPSHPSTTPESPPRSTGTSDDQTTLDEALRDAAWSNDVAVAASLLARGADINAQDSTSQSAYLVATSEGYLELLELALAHGAVVDAKDGWNGTGLIRAAERGHALVVGRLLQVGIDRDHVNRIGYQAIHEAVWMGKDTSAYADTIRALAAGGAALTTESRVERLTPLEMARERGHTMLEGVLTTTTNTAPISDPDGELLRAAGAGDADRVALALRAGAQIEARDDRDRTALLLAASHDRVDVARLLVSMGADPNALDGRHDTPWLVTGVTGSVAMLEALLPARPDLGMVNRYGGISLIPASERGHVEYVRRVVATEIDLDHINALGWTALLEAVILGDGGVKHQEIVRILLAAGADRSIADKDGVTALKHAQSQGYREIAAILEAR